MDLTKITTPFGLLDRETQKALKEHGGPYQFYADAGWEDTTFPNFVNRAVYRVRPEPPKPREWWINIHSGLPWVVYDTPVGAQKTRGPNCETIHVREVIE